MPLPPAITASDPCPRCPGQLGPQPGSSRADRAIAVCGDCAVDEAARQAAGFGVCPPLLWPVGFHLRFGDPTPAA